MAVTTIQTAGKQLDRAAAEHLLQSAVEHVENLEPVRPSDTQDKLAAEHVGLSNRVVALLKQPPTVNVLKTVFLHVQHKSQRC